MKVVNSDNELPSMDAYWLSSTDFRFPSGKNN